MDIKLLLVIIVFLAFAGTAVNADIYFDRVLPTLNDSKRWGYKCVPGRSYIVMGAAPNVRNNSQSAESGLDDGSAQGDEEDARRTHMNSGIKEEHCLICVCSVDGKEKHCIGRPARNVNECILMSQFNKEMKMGLPYAHDRIFAYRIRRDYIWNYDEIPYDRKAKCQRGVTYYSNNPNANDTDIDTSSSRESLLSYDNRTFCFYCVCSVDGNSVGCISRDPWYCEYYRLLRDEDYMRKQYKRYFRQDRPKYFRTLSYRMRRTMDGGLFSLLDIGGDALCCDHPNGHRRNLHSAMRNKIRQLRLRVPKENILGGSPHGDYEDFIVNND